jgi:hypothetical protein
MLISSWASHFVLANVKKLQLNYGQKPNGAKNIVIDNSVKKGIKNLNQNEWNFG